MRWTRILFPVLLLMLGACAEDPQQADNKAWAEAQEIGTAEAYKGYADANPDGAHFKEARAKVKDIRRADAWKRAKKTGTAEAYERFLGKFPKGVEAELARAELEKLADEGA